MPDNFNVSVTVRELLSDAVSLSDNVACDVLFRQLLRPFDNDHNHFGDAECSGDVSAE